MKILLGALVLFILGYFLYAGIRTYWYVHVSKRLIEEAVPYTRHDVEAGDAMLVLGDSTAVGVGADSPDDTVAGRVAEYLNVASVENYARSGAKVGELVSQAAHATEDRYRLILVQIGGNNIIALDDPHKTARELEEALKALPKAERIVVISAGDVGGAPLFPHLVRPLYTRRTIAFHEAFEEAVARAGATYVNLYKSPSTRVINERPDIYLSGDQLHPSSKGYALWFEAIRDVL